MGIKILTSVTPKSERMRKEYVIGTHGGIFHSDEVVAVAILCLLHKNEKVRIVRTRDMSILNECDICVDVGGGEYDHHQKGFNLCRRDDLRLKKERIPYASAGLIWKQYGEKLICKLLPDYFTEILNSGFDLLYVPTSAWRIIDDGMISNVDAEDNGIDVNGHTFSYVSSYLPLWFDDNYDEQFMKVLKVTINILEAKIVNTVEKCISEIVLRTRWNKRGSIEELIKGTCTFSDNILHIPSQTVPWLSAVAGMNIIAIVVPYRENAINFVIFPYPAGGWAAQCVPPSLEKKFDKRVPFPKEWAGQTDKLPEISGVADATFCHNGCFFVRAQSKRGVIKMCIKAMMLARN
ncbi:MAG: MYG1 family protein [Clostridia bacterium]|nr:MYG1 family protein [Clostridia bacterium]